MMRPSMKMGLIGLIGVCLIFYQYHLSTGIRPEQVSELATAEGQAAYGSTNLQTNEHLADYTRQNITEKFIRLAVGSVIKTRGLSPDVGNSLIQELANHFSVILSTTAKNASSKEIENNEDSYTAKPAEESFSKDGQSVPCIRAGSNSSPDPLYIITPTYRRPEQIPELTRMAHTLMLAENIHWLVIEDANSTSPQITELLKRTGLAFEHLVAPMPEQYKKLKNGLMPRGVSNRNRGLKWIRANATKGVLYFADDDNTYDMDLFKEIRKTNRVSMFPVGLCTKFGLSSPIVKDGKFVGFYDGWISSRKFPVDMAGFAVSVDFLLKRPKAMMPYKAGYEEDGFLKSLAPFEPHEIELLADNCTRILAWHTQTKKNMPSAPIDMKIHHSTNIVVLKQQIV